MNPYERLDAWKQAHNLALMVYRLTERWPSHERFGITSQVRRAAVSVPSNLAEGAAKRGRREFRRYIDIALGSLSELRSLLHLARDLGYVSDASHAEVDVVRDRTGRMIWRLYQAMQ